MFAIGRRGATIAISCLLAYAAWGINDLLRPDVPTETAVENAQDSEAHFPPWCPEWLASKTSGQRFVMWALFVGIVPIGTAPLAFRVLGTQSNVANAFVLAGYTSLGIAAAYTVGGVRIGGVLSGLFYLIGLLTVFTYNLWICAFIARLHEK